MFCGGGWSVHMGRVSSIYELYPPDFSSISLAMKEIVSGYHISPKEAKLLMLKTMSSALQESLSPISTPQESVSQEGMPGLCFPAHRGLSGERTPLKPFIF